MSIIDLNNIVENATSHCDLNKIQLKSVKVRLLSAIKKIQISKSNSQELASELGSQNNARQLLNNLTLPINNSTEKSKKTKNKNNVPKAFVIKKGSKLLDNDDQEDFHSEIDEIIEILLNTVIELNSDAATKKVCSAIDSFVKNGFKSFKEHRKHIEKEISHIYPHTVSSLHFQTLNIVKSKINRLNEINSLNNPTLTFYFL